MPNRSGVPAFFVKFVYFVHRPKKREGRADEMLVSRRVSSPSAQATLRPHSRPLSLPSSSPFLTLKTHAMGV